MTYKSLVCRLCLLSLLSSVTLAAPVAEPIEEIDSEPGLVKRAGGSHGDPIDATFNIAGWPNIAEENCFVMLCMLGGERV